MRGVRGMCGMRGMRGMLGLCGMRDMRGMRGLPGTSVIVVGLTWETAQPLYRCSRRALYIQASLT